jgi:RNA polymerase sigma-70 factor (ECF subfamily)
MELLANADSAIGLGDASLVDSVRAGETRAVAKLYDQHHRILRNLALRLIGDPDVADDLVHEVFVDLPKAVQRFREDALLSTFLCGMLARKSNKFIRSAMRARRAMSRVALERRPAVENPESYTMRRSLAESIDRALDVLSVDQRVAFVLCEVEDKTSFEAALLLRVRPATVRTRLFHAKRKLRDVLEREGWR